MTSFSPKAIFDTLSKSEIHKMTAKLAQKIASDPEESEELNESI